MSIKLARSLPLAGGNQRSCLIDALRDLWEEAYQSLRRPVGGQCDDPGQTLASRAEGESAIAPPTLKLQAGE